MKTFVVLGMHRSATSLISKGINNDIDMGVETVHCTPDNPNGHWENWVFVKLNDHILRAAGGSWHDPPSEKRILDTIKIPYIKDSIQECIKRFEKPARWGWKDPRTTLTIKLFMPFLTNPHIICCFRDPAEIANSLKKRGCMGYETALTLCREYNSRLKSFIDEYYCNNSVYSCI